MTESMLLARVRDFLFENGPALPHEVASACGVPVSLVTRMVREGTLMELRPAETTSCEACNAHGIVGSLCPACRRKFSSSVQDEPAARRPGRAPAATWTPQRRRFHTRRG
jgi:hypothetical protein